MKFFSFTLIVLFFGNLLSACLPGNRTPVPPTPAPPVSEAVTAEALVYFLSSGRYALGIEPYTEPVVRTYPAGTYLPEAVLTSYFQGPTEEERERGLEAITSGFSGVRRLEVLDGTAHVYLEGECASQGAAFNISQLIYENLVQLTGIRAVKIYDEHGETGDPDGPGSSIPFCLEP
jgi:hypothetical protein